MISGRQLTADAIEGRPSDVRWSGLGVIIRQK